MPWIVSDRSYRVSGTLGDVLVPTRGAIEVAGWAYSILIALEGVQAWTPGTPLPDYSLDPFPRHVVPDAFYDPHHFDAVGSPPDADTFGGYPV